MRFLKILIAAFINDNEFIPNVYLLKTKFILFEYIH